ncbi:glycosyltransferase [Yoonia sp. 2307UL14-13]|uniref:glycosyltransferase n=1 Tax=Yoonia sp. 2307UL14-13 TaxID=3126506 RepID=UPI0030A1681C
MKILLVSPFENGATGRGDRNLRLEAELRARGHHVVYVTGDFDHAAKKRIPKNLLSDREGLKVLHAPSYHKNVGISRMWCHLVLALRLWAFGFKERWDVVVISSIPPEMLIAARFLRKRATVVDIRDIWPDALLAYGKQSLIKRIFGSYCHLIFKFTLKDADRTMIVAPGFRQWLNSYRKMPVGSVKFVPLGFCREDFRPLASGSGKYDFCYAGGATPQFDIREFAEEFKEKRGVILGSGPLLDDWREAFPNAEFRGAVSRSEAMSVMQRSQLLLFPSNPFAQLPNKAFDYFALGHRVAIGQNCSRATRSLLRMRHRRETNGSGRWQDYAIIEKEALANRAADIVEAAVS